MFSKNYGAKKCFILKDPHLQYNFDKYETKHSYVICKMFRHFEVCSKYELFKILLLFYK